MSGWTILDEVHGYLGRFVAYPSGHAHDAHTLWIAHTHLMDVWESTPRIAFLSPEPGSGKTRALEASALLVPRPIEAVNATPAYLFRKVSDPAGPPTILYDEIDTLFGPKAKDNEEIRGVLNSGHRRGAVAGRCVVKGKTVETEELPSYCAVALAGLGTLPDTLLSRSVVVRMRRRAPEESIEPFRERTARAVASALSDRLAAWAEDVAPRLADTWPEMPEGVDDRDADVWEALVAVADAAGGDWPARARAAAVALVAEAKASSPSLGIRLLADLREVFGERETMHTEDILTVLHAMEEAPWSDLKGAPLNARGLAARLKPYGVRSTKVRIGAKTLQGYTREGLHDPWARYLPAPESVPDVPDVPHPMAGAPSPPVPLRSNPLGRQEMDGGVTSEAPVGVAAYGSGTSGTSGTSAGADWRDEVPADKDPDHLFREVAAYLAEPAPADAPGGAS